MAKKKSIHYVDNKKFHEEMVAYKNHCADVKKKDPDAVAHTASLAAPLFLGAHRLLHRDQVAHDSDTVGAP